MPASKAAIDTPKGRAYMRQFCKHFAHKAGDDLTVELAESSGRLAYVSPEFGLEVLTLTAAEMPGPLTLNASCESVEGLADLETWTGDHLERFGRREALRVEWLAAGD